MTRYSLPTLNWLDLPGGGPRFSLEEILDTAAAAGFRVGRPRRRHSRGSRRHRRDAARGGLACTDVGILVLGPDAAADAERLATLARASGATTCLVAWPAGVDGYSALEASADVLSANRVRLALEFFPYGALPTLESALAACEAVGWDRCGVLLDRWHFFHRGEPWNLLRSVINSLGYRGVISAEVLSTTFREQEPLEGARRLMNAFRTHWPVS